MTVLTRPLGLTMQRLCVRKDPPLCSIFLTLHTLPRPAQSLPQDIQSAASAAAQSFDVHRKLLLSPHSSYSQPQSSKPPEEEIEREVWCESGNGETQEAYSMLSMSEVDSWADSMFESPNMMLIMAEALLLTPPRMHEYDDESESVKQLYPLWND
ncbi:hypothetical protein SUGI_0906870 [Cryptomeria japonica]|nr:hypothetical protein SUGI_0906870 [Cryptomeria japonica]